MVTPVSYCVRWGKHQTNMSSASCNLFNSQMLVDVTLAADGVQIQAHKLVLAASSVYFQALFTQNPCQHPIVILKDVSIEELRIIIDFVYKGEVEVPDDKLTSVLKTARLLRINGFGDAVMNETIPPHQVRRASIHTGGAKPAPMWHSSSSSSTSSGQGLALFSSLPSETDYEQASTSSPDVPGGKRKVPQTPPQPQHQQPESSATMVMVSQPHEVNSYHRQSAMASAVPSPPQAATSQENVPFRKRLRREFSRRERSLSGGDGSHLAAVYPERSTSMILPSRSTSQVETASHPYLNVDAARPPMQTQTSDPGPMRTEERPTSPSMNYTSKHRKMLQRQPRIQRQLEQEAEEAAARRCAALKPRPSPTIIVTPDDESRPPEVICARKSSPEPERPRSPESDTSVKDLTIDEGEGVWSARSCPPSPPPSKISERSSSTTSHRERRRKMQVVFSSAPPMSGHHGESSGTVSVLVSPTPVPSPASPAVLSPLVPVPLPVVSSSGHHCPESRTGSAVSCDYCWNKMDEKGRVQRRKTKYWCPKCRANLCIVPCFQQYHETTESNPGTSSGSGGAGGGGDLRADVVKARYPFERSSSATHLLTVPKNLSKTSSI